MKKLLMGVVLVLIISLIGCIEDDMVKDLRDKITELEEQVKEKDIKINELKTKVKKKNKYPSLSYVEVKEDKVFVDKEIQAFVYPEVNTSLRSIPKNSIIQVLDRVWVGGSSTNEWLYVTIPVQDSPMDMKGWIKSKDTYAYTEDIKNIVQSDILVKEGTEVYEVELFDQIETTKSIKLSYDVIGRIEEKKEGFYRISYGGGGGFWVEEEYIVYPD